MREENSASVANPRLLAAIRKYRRARALENATQLFDELKVSVFLAALPGGKPGAVVSLAVVKGAEGSRLALFTDATELRSFTRGRKAAFVISAKEAMAQVLANGYAGMVINPSGEATLELDAQFVKNVFPRM